MSMLQIIAREYRAFKEECKVEQNKRDEFFRDINYSTKRDAEELGIYNLNEAHALPVDDSFEAFLESQL